MESQIDPRSISRFRWLIVCLANEITNSELKKAKFLVKDRLGARNFEKIKDTFDFFDKLQEGNHFHEGDTLLLRHILSKIGRNDLIEELNRYNSEYAVVARHCHRHPAASEGPFIGRNDRLDELFFLLKEKRKDEVATICISGLPGMGKTRLAKEACYRQIEYHELLFVDLRELSTLESIFNAVMHALGEDTSLNVDIDVVIWRLKLYRPKKAGGAVLLFDNADRPLRTPEKGVNDDVYNTFVELIERIIDCGNDCLKVLITTRMGLPQDLCTHYDNCVFQIPIRADELKDSDAIDILQYSAGKTEISGEDAKRLIHLCGKCPLALKVTGSRLQDRSIPPKKLIEYLDNKSDNVFSLELYGGINLGACLKNTFDSLPDKQKFHMVRLSAIPGTFTSRAALAVLGMKQVPEVEVNLQLQDLKYRNLIETLIDDDEDVNKSDIRYGLHLLMRQFLQKIARSNKSITIHYRQGEEEFVNYYLKKLKKIGKMTEKNYKKAIKKKNDDAANFQELLRLLPKQKRDVETDEWRKLASTIELFYSTKERLKFFKAQRQLAEQNQSTLEFVEMSAYEGLQMSRINYHYEEILPLLQNAEQVLLKATNTKPIHTDKRSLSSTLFKKKAENYFAKKHIQNLNAGEKEKLFLLYHLWGNVCTTCGYDLDNANERIQIAYALVKELNLKNTNTARFYSTMADVIKENARLQKGNDLFEKSKLKEAMDFYNMAYNLRKDLTGSENHPDIPVYLANIGACYYHLEEIEKAIEYYKRSLQVEDEMVLENEEGRLKTLRSLALAYRDVGRYEDAIDLGKKCVTSRVELLGDHTDTARAYYLLGLFYLERNERGDLKVAEQKFEGALKVEERLWKLGKPHSVDWENLKRKIQIVLIKTSQKMKYPAYKRRFDRADRKSSQGPLETNVTDADAEAIYDSSDESVDENVSMQITEEPTEKLIARKRHSSDSCSSEDDYAQSMVSQDSGISSMASAKGQGDQKKKLKY
ncbi:uncharacterized protein LOC117122934 [Anneissia japonica]|uniref:uncharacterized protein LOC117122934 n=1 Tax=Anneissia japonica TaxID=1529436 RepID=UPI00142556BA|nr:uncharacterized protein LOC117122934 [Anneissia japonica]